MRLDRALAARGLARSRSHAHQLILAGSVVVDGATARKPGHDVGEETPISVTDPAARYVARSALKLAGVLDRASAQGLAIDGRACLDVGASTGGFTQVLLERGAASVLAVDVGHGQLAAQIADDPRVDAREGVNARDFSRPRESSPVDMVVADLSFISLTLVVEPLATWLRPGGDALLMVKPQFEVGAESLGAGGVVRDPAQRAAAVRTVAEAMELCGLMTVDVLVSPLSGPAGNVEIFVWGRKTWEAGTDPHGAPPLTDEQREAAITREVLTSA